MKNFLIILICGSFALSCSKRKQFSETETYIEPAYDTTAIDSFSTGAVSANVAAQIRRSSIAYRDSLKAISDAAAEAKKKAELETLKKEAEKKESDKKKEEDKKKAKKEEKEQTPNAAESTSN